MERGVRQEKPCKDQHDRQWSGGDKTSVWKQKQSHCIQTCTNACKSEMYVQRNLLSNSAIKKQNQCRGATDYKNKNCEPHQFLLFDWKLCLMLPTTITPVRRHFDWSDGARNWTCMADGQISTLKFHSPSFQLPVEIIAGLFAENTAEFHCSAWPI